LILKKEKGKRKRCLLPRFRSGFEFEPLDYAKTAPEWVRFYYLQPIVATPNLSLQLALPNLEQSLFKISTHNLDAI
jgi:hypothetical protein